MDNMGILEKLATLFKSRRSAVLAAEAVIALLVVANLFLPMVNAEAVDLPDIDSLTERVFNLFEKFAGILGALGTLIAWLGSAKGLIESFTIRPPGALDRVGLAGAVTAADCCAGKKP